MTLAAAVAFLAPISAEGIDECGYLGADIGYGSECEKARELRAGVVLVLAVIGVGGMVYSVLVSNIAVWDHAIGGYRRLSTRLPPDDAEDDR